MSHELIHASVPRGLRGDVGYCIVSMTRGLPEELVPALEGLSAYDMNEDLALGADQTEWAYRVLSLQGNLVPVLSRIVPCAQEWRGRSNRVAHHIVLDSASLAPAGPAWMLLEHRHFASVPPPVEERPEGPVLPNGSLTPRPGCEWRIQGFDPGWAGVVAQAIADAGTSTVYLAFNQRVSVLPLLVDVFALLPEAKRWAVTFSTRFGSTVAGSRCQVRCVLADRAERAGLLRESGSSVLYIDRGEALSPSTAADAGREGHFVTLPQGPVAVAAASPPTPSTSTARSSRGERAPRELDRGDLQIDDDEEIVIRDGIRPAIQRISRSAPVPTAEPERVGVSPASRPAASSTQVARSAPPTDAGASFQSVGPEAARPAGGLFTFTQPDGSAHPADMPAVRQVTHSAPRSRPMPLPAILFLVAGALLALAAIIGLIKFL